MKSPNRSGDRNQAPPAIYRRGEAVVELGSASVRLVDARLFHSDRVDFCRLFLRSKALRGKVRKARIDLEDSACLVEFHAEDAAPDAVATTLASALREALAGESKRGGRSFFGRKRALDCASIIAYPEVDHTSVWETRAVEADRLTLRGPDAGRSRLGRVRRVFSRLPGVEQCRASDSSSLQILFKSPPGHTNWVVDLAESVKRAADRPGRETSRSFVSESAVERLVYFGLALGAIGLAVVAVIVPGVPTVPILLAAGYFSARSSVALHDHLRRSWFVGPILTDLEDRRGLSPESRLKLIGLITTLALISLGASGFDPNIALVVVLAAGISLHGVMRIPPAEPEPLRLVWS